MPKRKFSSSSVSVSRPKKRVRRASRPTRKSLRKSRVPRKCTSLSVHSYSRYGTPASDLTLVSATELDYAELFQLQNIAGYTEFNNLYDRYRITCVQVQITLVNNPDSIIKPNGDNSSNVQWTGTNWYPKLWWVNDYDDNQPIDLIAMRERSGVRSFVLRPNKMFKINVRPSVLNQTYRTLTTTGYTPKWGQWIDMAQVNVPYFGLKWILDTQGLPPLATHPFMVRVERKYFFTCKDVI